MHVHTGPVGEGRVDRSSLRQEYTDDLPKSTSSGESPRDVHHPPLRSPLQVMPSRLTPYHQVRAALLVAASLILLTPLATAGDEDIHTGTNGTCADFNALYLTPSLKLEAIPAQGGTGYVASHEGGTELYIDFYDAEGRHVGDNSRNTSTTPKEATATTLCVGQLGGGWPDLPAPGATWTYQDGL